MLLGAATVLLSVVPPRPAAAPSVRVPSVRMQQPWDLPRFVETATFFNGPGEVLKRILPSPPRPPVGRNGLIWGASRLDLLEFGPLDDVVMGGASQSGFSLAPSRDFGVWSGSITTENNGGFAGVRSRAVTPAMDLSAFRGIRLRVKGDGKRYKLIVRGDARAPLAPLRSRPANALLSALRLAVPCRADGPRSAPLASCECPAERAALGRAVPRRRPALRSARVLRMPC